ncbi:MAG TPA: 3-hydroxyacyl-CoA dehydrogenase NAD-binding domain-containing protein [Planctomycetaceae bacterium]|jgi:3-hydroxyacyl-CoA dehydrogenase|nr:3-hydroxyacyl-CoA dehydrogenase NAD-binding domain-containing protein [Planctomycetaceae bacterium]
MSDLVTLSKDGDVAVVTINNPPVNALSPGVPEGVIAHVQAAAADPSVKAIVLIGGGKTFVAGADIKEFAKIRSGAKERGPGLHPMLTVVENCAKPVVCAIHGTAFGGGLELAQACHYRVAVPNSQVGQPEVKLGLIPGGAGTQHLPRLAGVVRAAELCAIGNPIPAKQAHEWGIVDQLIEGDLLAGAVKYARSQAGKPPRKTRDIQDRFGDPATIATGIAELKKQVAKTWRGMQAPYRAIEAVEAAAKLPFEEGVKKEAELFRECLFSNESKSLIHVFFGERTVAKIPDLPNDIKPIDVKSAAVIGAGTMGGGITMTYVNAGIPVTLKEVGQAELDRGLETIKRNYGVSVQRGKMTQAQVDQKLAMIKPTLNYEDIKDADIVVEAVFENMELKKKVFGEIDKVAKPGAVLASNTSTLDVDAIAASTKRPQMVVGNHFFSPANVMKLLEIVRGKQSSKEVLATSMALAKKLGKVGVLVGNCWGFVGNRMFGPYMREAAFLVEEGAKVQDVDAALFEFGMAMGPLAVGDLAGLDVGYKVRKEAEHKVPAGMRPHLADNRLVEAGRHGQKTGAGWYKYEKGNRAPMPDPEAEKIIVAAVKEANIAQRKIGKEEIIERTIYGLINEGAAILDEGHALRSVDIDIVYIYGYGFPAFRGGPMFYADTIGLKKVYDRVCQFEKEHGFWWKPSPLLKRLAEAGQTFADFDHQKWEGGA